VSTPESKVKTAVRRLLDEQGIWFFMPPANGFGKGGIPDIVGCAPITITPDMVGQTIGVFVGVECKAPGKLNAVTENQKARLQEIDEAAGFSFVADGVSELRQALAAWGLLRG
jgi:hypothetical protein